MGEIFSGAVLGAVLTVVGFCYLHLRWRRRAIVRRVLANQYESSYANAGLLVGVQLVAAVGVVLVISLFVALAWSLVKVR